MGQTDCTNNDEHHGPNNSLQLLVKWTIRIPVEHAIAQGPQAHLPDAPGFCFVALKPISLDGEWIIDLGEVQGQKFEFAVRRLDVEHEEPESSKPERLVDFEVVRISRFMPARKCVEITRSEQLSI